MYPKTGTLTLEPKISGHISEDRAKLREKILKSSVQTRAQLYYMLTVLQESREGARQLGRDDWYDQINTWIGRLGAMYNALLYLQVNVYEHGLNNNLMKLKDLQKEMKNITAIRTDALFLKCLKEMPNALNAPANTIEEEMKLLKEENEAKREAKFSAVNDPWN